AFTLSSGTLPSNIIANPRSDLKAITTRSDVSYDGPQIPPPPSFLPKVVKNETETTKDTPVASPVSAPKPNQRPSIPYPSRLQDQKLRDKGNDQREKFFQIFKDLNFNISFADAHILMPKFSPSIKNLLTNKDKLCELARTPLNEHCSVVLLKKLPEKLGDPGKFLIPCDFPGKAECLALADLDASINLMPLSVWNKLSLLDLSPTCMTIELSDHSTSRPVGAAEDVYVKVGTFHFPVDFIVVDFDADPRVPLILERSFLKTGRTLIDVFEEIFREFSNEIAASNFNQEREEPPRNSDIRQLIREECCIEVCKEQKKNMEDTLRELLEVCRQKEFYCMHNDIDDLIESALNSKLLSINLKSQRLDKKKQEVKNIVEQPTKRGTRITESLQHFRFKRSYISLNNTSQISPVHAITPVLPTKEPEYSLSMRYEHLSTNLETESGEVIKSSAKNLLLIPSEYKVTFDDESECDVPVKDESSLVFTPFSNPIFDDND
nr:reverse transcriptase domain-containing protein [Tanacetum cinerariifolium]